jgi:hypothetical protein
VGTGFLAQHTGLARTEEAIAGAAIDPSQKARIRAVGTVEAGRCVTVGAGTGALPFLLGTVAVALGLALRKPSAS